MTTEAVEAVPAEPARTRKDRWADWAVLGVVAVALILGAFVMALVQGQRETYTDAAAGLTVRYPKEWLLKPAEDSVFQAADPAAGDFKTAFQVRVWPIAATEGMTQTLAVVLTDASLARAQGVTAFRLFDMAEGRPVGGEPSMEASYVYVAESSDLFTQRTPVVVEGLDVAVARGDRAYVFSLLADQDTFEAMLPVFRRFVATAEIE